MKLVISDKLRFFNWQRDRIADCLKISNYPCQIAS